MHMPARDCALCLCAWGVHECTHLPAGRSASPSSKLHAEILTLCIFSYMLRSMHGPWEGAHGSETRVLVGGARIQTQNLPILRLGQVGSLNLARSIPGGESQGGQAQLPSCTLPPGDPELLLPTGSVRGHPTCFLIPPQFYMSKPKGCSLTFEGKMVQGTNYVRKS